MIWPIVPDIPDEVRNTVIAGRLAAPFVDLVVIGLLYLTYPDGCWHELTFLVWQEGLPSLLC